MFLNYHFFGMDIIWWLIWFTALILFFSFFVPVHKKHAKQSPLDILQRRFSNGEISVHEYEQRRRFLEKDHDLRIKLFFRSSLSNR